LAHETWNKSAAKTNQTLNKESKQTIFRATNFVFPINITQFKIIIR